jgi:hypothetical protein
VRRKSKQHNQKLKGPDTTAVNSKQNKTNKNIKATDAAAPMSENTHYIVFPLQTMKIIN